MDTPGEDVTDIVIQPFGPGWIWFVRGQGGIARNDADLQQQLGKLLTPLMVVKVTQPNGEDFFAGFEAEM